MKTLNLHNRTVFYFNTLDINEINEISNDINQTLYDHDVFGLWWSINECQNDHGNTRLSIETSNTVIISMIKDIIKGIKS